MDGAPFFSLAGGHVVHNCKNPATKTFKASFALRKHADQGIVMSGTPAVQGHHHLWAQAAVADLGQALGPSYSAFLRANFIKSGFTIQPAPGATRAIQKKIAHMATAMRPEDAVQLPPLVRKMVTLPLEEQVRNLITSASRGAGFRFRATDGQAVEMGPTEVPASIAMRVWQLSQGFIKLGDDGSFAVLHDTKIEALLDLIEEIGDEPLVVAHHFQADRLRILRALEAEGVGEVGVFDTANAQDLREQIARWQAGRIRVLLIHPQAGGHGIDGLQGGGRHLAWFGQTWSRESALQLEARLHRSGQAHTVFVHHLEIQAPSIDSAIAQAIAAGTAGNLALLEALAWIQVRNERPDAPEADMADAVQERLAELRRRMQKTHPDHGGDADEFIRAKREFDELRAQARAEEQA